VSPGIIINCIFFSRSHRQQLQTCSRHRDTCTDNTGHAWHTRLQPTASLLRFTAVELADLDSKCASFHAGADVSRKILYVPPTYGVVASGPRARRNGAIRIGVNSSMRICMQRRRVGYAMGNGDDREQIVSRPQRLVLSGIATLRRAEI
jgi:hypothetical protein